VPKGWIDVDEMLQLLYLTRPDFPLNSKNLGPKHHQRRKQEAWPLKVQGELIPKASWIFWGHHSEAKKDTESKIAEVIQWYSMSNVLPFVF
jgi:hypothetical protein